jgi:hypothetical protein
VVIHCWRPKMLGLSKKHPGSAGNRRAKFGIMKAIQMRGDLDYYG